MTTEACELDAPAPLVTDTSIWIDLHFGELLERVFSLPYVWLIADVVAEELIGPDRDLLVARGLQVRELPAEGVLEVVRLAARYPRPSRADLFALVLASLHHAVLVTGDAALRAAAEQERVTVHGTLWLLDELLRGRIVAPGLAASALERMITFGSRFPHREVARRLRRWRAET